MEKFASLLNDILLQAKREGLSQKELAARAGVRQETLSRAKKRGTMDSLTIERLARVLHADFSITPLATPVSSDAVKTAEKPVAEISTSPPIGLKDPKWMLSWSNPDIDDDVLIRKALMTARFGTILQACLDFSLARVLTQWSVVSGDAALNARSVRELISDILSNIQEGFKAQNSGLARASA